MTEHVGDMAEKVMAMLRGEGPGIQSAAEAQRKSLETRRAEWRDGWRTKRAELIGVALPPAPGLRGETRAMFCQGQPKPTKALRSVARFFEEDARFLVLMGGIGTGKTLAAIEACVLEHRKHVERWCNAVSRLEDPGNAPPPPALRKSRRAEWCLASSVSRRVEPWKQDLDAGAVALRLKAPVLVVDDLGTERKDDRFASAFGELVETRQGGSLRTVITTNLPRSEIRDRYGDRIADRLNHSGFVVQLGSESMRKRGKL